VAVAVLAGVLAGASARADDGGGPMPTAQSGLTQPASGTPKAETGMDAKPASEQLRRAQAGETRLPDAKTPPPADQPPRAVGADGCEVPGYLLETESALARVASAVKARQRLDVLVVGSASSALAGPEGPRTSYPARLEAALQQQLSGIEVNVTTELRVKKTAAEVAEGLEKLVQDRKPALVVWQTGTFDALKSIDPDDFRAAIDEGVVTMQAAGADVVLMNLQYSPRMETMITVAPYLDNMRVSAEQHDVPLFDRFAMMRHWNESGTFDLFNPSHGYALASRVHNCLGYALATFVIDAAHINPAELGTQR
jgi:hypothetical protein